MDRAEVEPETRCAPDQSLEISAQIRVILPPWNSAEYNAPHFPRPVDKGHGRWYNAAK